MDRHHQRVAFPGSPRKQRLPVRRAHLGFGAVEFERPLGHVWLALERERGAILFDGVQPRQLPLCRLSQGGRTADAADLWHCHPTGAIDLAAQLNRYWRKRQGGVFGAVTDSGALLAALDGAAV